VADRTAGIDSNKAITSLSPRVYRTIHKFHQKN